MHVFRRLSVDESVVVTAVALKINEEKEESHAVCPFSCGHWATPAQRRNLPDTRKQMICDLGLPGAAFAGLNSDVCVMAR